MPKWSYGRLIDSANEWLPNTWSGPGRILTRLAAKGEMTLRDRRTRLDSGKILIQPHLNYPDMLNLRKAGCVEGEGRGPWKLTERGKFLARWPTLTKEELFPYMFQEAKLVKTILRRQKQLREEKRK